MAAEILDFYTLLGLKKCTSYSLANDFISFVRTAHENNTVVSLSSMEL